MLLAWVHTLRAIALVCYASKPHVHTEKYRFLPCLSCLLICSLLYLLLFLHPPVHTQNSDAYLHLLDGCESLTLMNSLTRILAFCPFWTSLLTSPLHLDYHSPILFLGQLHHRSSPSPLRSHIGPLLLFSGGFQVPDFQNPTLPHSLSQCPSRAAVPTSG